MFIDTDVSSDSFDDAIRESCGGKLRKEKKKDKLERRDSGYRTFYFERNANDSKMTVK